jgi:CHASE3 domain sensor protein
MMEHVESLQEMLDRVAKEALNKASELIAQDRGGGMLDEAAALIRAAACARRAEVTPSLGEP